MKIQAIFFLLVKLKPYPPGTHLCWSWSWSWSQRATDNLQIHVVYTQLKSFQSLFRELSIPYCFSCQPCSFYQWCPLVCTDGACQDVSLDARRCSCQKPETNIECDSLLQTSTAESGGDSSPWVIGTAVGASIAIIIIAALVSAWRRRKVEHSGVQVRNGVEVVETGEVDDLSESFGRQPSDVHVAMRWRKMCHRDLGCGWGWGCRSRLGGNSLRCVFRRGAFFVWGLCTPGWVSVRENLWTCTGRFRYIGFRHRLEGGIGSEGRKGGCRHFIVVELRWRGEVLMDYAVLGEKRLGKSLDFSMQLWQKMKGWWSPPDAIARFSSD